MTKRIRMSERIAKQPIQNDIDAQEELLEERDAEEQLEHGAEIARDMDDLEEDSDGGPEERGPFESDR